MDQQEVTQIKETNTLLQGILDAATSVAFIATDENGLITLFSAGAEAMLGYKAEEIVGKETPLIFHKKEELETAAKEVSEKMNRKITGFQVFEEAVKAGLIDEREWTYVRKDGTNIDVRISFRYISGKSGKIVGRLGIARDITGQKKNEEERRRLEGQLRQAQKREAIGTLAGGIAHDFNNILSIIFGYGDLAIDDVPPDHPVSESISQIIKAATRAKDLVQQILTYSRQMDHEIKPLRVGPIIKETMQMMRSTLPATIDTRTDIATVQDIVMANPSDIHQVIMNLCVNAGHAMKEGGGILEVKTGCVNLGLEDLENKAMSPGTFLRLSVKDTGIGISSRNLDRIFDPYFTTRKKGEGTGLGLSVVQGIVREYGGDITVASEPGKGSEFTVYLPTIESREAAKVRETHPAPRGDEHILLVDDEPEIVEVGRKMLEKLGYKITYRTCSRDALEYFKGKGRTVDLVITDQIMPNMTGIQLIQKIRQITPGIPVILISGFSETVTESMLETHHIDSFISKPILINDMGRVIREVLDKR